MSSSIAVIKDCSILNHSASILFWEKMIKVRFHKPASGHAEPTIPFSSAEFVTTDLCSAHFLTKRRRWKRRRREKRKRKRKKVECVF